MLNAGRSADAGFTLVEMMVVLAIAVLLTLAALPMVGNWIAQAQIRSAADAMQNAVRLAQGEAIKRSRTAVLMLTNSTPNASATPATGGTRWVVRLLARATDDGETDQDLFVRGGTEPANLGVEVKATVNSDTNNIALMCFNAFGQQTTVDQASTGLDVECTAPAKTDSPTTFTFSHTGVTSELALQVSLGGQVHMCDPSKTLSSSVPEGCASS
jgi:type IV fimbrial biogenesis protein FimT